MKTLIVEDDFTSRRILQELLKSYGPNHIAANGKEAVEAACAAREAGEPYDLICLDIMMPEMDGQEALKQIRDHEVAHGVRSTKGTKILMATALSDMGHIKSAFYELSDGYLIKPIRRAKLLEELSSFGLVP